MIIMFMVIIGLILGSFINLLSYRLTQNKKILTIHSICGTCGHTLSMVDLIPVLNFILLQGKCRYCGASIPKYFPVVELLMGGILPMLWQYTANPVMMALWTLFFLLYVVSVITDMRAYALYSVVLYPLVGISIGIAVLNGNIVPGFVLGVTICLIIFGIAWLLSVILKKPAMGDGDYFFFLIFSLALQPEQLLYLILFSSVSGIVLAVLFREKKFPFITLTFIPFFVIFFFFS